MLRQKTLFGLALASALALGFLAALLIFPIRQSDGDTCSGRYPFLSTKVGCVDDNSNTFVALDARLEEATSLYVRTGKAKRVSVWARDLVTSRWAASNETEIYSPASLLKLPVLIAYYRYAMLSPNILTESILYKGPLGKVDSTLHFTKPTTLVSGTSYSVSDLLSKMITNSDNDASLTLSSKVEPAFYQQTLIDLGIQVPTDKNVFDYVTAKSYANMFRILYTASYLTPELSEKALDLLSQSTFKGIGELLPSSIQIAHKFGERTIIGPDGSIQTRELHDCGIIYRKNANPYSLCVMTEGDNFDDLLTVIQNISLLTYNNI